MSKPFVLRRAVLGFCAVSLIPIGSPLASSSAVVKLRLTVDEPRPVAAAMRILEQRHGIRISYEDPRYVRGDEIVDVTEAVARTQAARRVLIPRAGRIDLEYDAGTSSGELSDPGAVIDAVLKGNRANQNPGRFRMINEDGFYHIIPSSRADVRGKRGFEQPVLDAPVQLPGQKSTGLAVLTRICELVEASTGAKVQVGMIPTAPFLKDGIEFQASKGSARDVLVKTLNQVEPNLSWQLFYDPGIQKFFLNVHQVVRTHASGLP